MDIVRSRMFGGNGSLSLVKLSVPVPLLELEQREFRRTGMRL